MLAYTIFILPDGDGKVKTYSPDFSIYADYEDYGSAIEGMTKALEDKVKELKDAGEAVAEPLDFVGCIKVSRKQMDKFDHSKALAKILQIKG